MATAGQTCTPVAVVTFVPCFAPVSAPMFALCLSKMNFALLSQAPSYGMFGGLYVVGVWGFCSAQGCFAAFCYSLGMFVLLCVFGCVLGVFWPRVDGLHLAEVRECFAAGSTSCLAVATRF